MFDPTDRQNLKLLTQVQFQQLEILMEACTFKHEPDGTSVFKANWHDVARKVRENSHLFLFPYAAELTPQQEQRMAEALIREAEYVGPALLLVTFVNGLLKLVADNPEMSKSQKVQLAKAAARNSDFLNRQFLGIGEARGREKQSTVKQENLFLSSFEKWHEQVPAIRKFWKTVKGMTRNESRRVGLMQENFPGIADETIAELDGKHYRADLAIIQAKAETAMPQAMDTLKDLIKDKRSRKRG